MQWYIPMTIIPGIGLLILSTSNIMLSLNNEISQLNSQRDKRLDIIIRLKLAQLKRISIAIVFQYTGVLFFLLSGIIKSMLAESDNVAKLLLTSGVILISLSLIGLLVYSIKAVTIRQKHLRQ